MKELIKFASMLSMYQMGHIAISRFFICIAICTVSFSVSAQHDTEEEGEEERHHALNSERSLTFGIASPYSFELDALGINGRMYYNLGETICFGPEYAYLKSDDIEVIDFDFVGHYIFETPWVGIYPFAGVNYSIEKELEHDETIAEVGLVFGAGMHRNFKYFTAFVEYSRVEYGINDQFVTAGFFYTFH